MGACSVEKVCNLRINTSSCRFSKLCKPNFSAEFAFPRPNDDDPIWRKIFDEAISDAKREPILRHHYCKTILSHASLESALANLLAAKLSSPSISETALRELFLGVLAGDGGSSIVAAAREDLRAAKERDPACLSHAHCFLNFKGFQSIQAHRLAHELWAQNRASLAALIQSRVSEVFAVDIHPGARIGSGVVIDHATGVVIGETAVVGDNVTILHSVTLGGTGKVGGDRHPKIGDGVFVGAGTKVLGNVRVGDSARIGAGSVVLKDVPPYATAVGNPARLIERKN